MNKTNTEKFNSYGTLLTVTALIVVVIYTNGTFDEWDLLIGVLGALFGAFYLGKGVAFDLPSRFLAGLITSISVAVIWRSAEVLQQYCTREQSLNIPLYWIVGSAIVLSLLSWALDVQKEK